MPQWCSATDDDHDESKTVFFIPGISLRQNQACPFKLSFFLNIEGCETLYMLLALPKCLGICEVVDLKKNCLCHLCIVLKLYSWMLIRQSIKKVMGV
jgi:hypothetical protein